MLLPPRPAIAVYIELSVRMSVPKRRLKAHRLCSSQRTKGALEVFERRRDDFNVICGKAVVRRTKSLIFGASNAAREKLTFSSLTFRSGDRVEVQQANIERRLKNRLPAWGDFKSKPARLQLPHGSALV